MSRRQDVLWCYLERWQRETSASWATIATVVRETYHHMVPEHARVVVFSNHRDAYERSRLDAQTLKRVRTQDAGFPMDLEDACILALPERYQQDCINELAARLGQHSGPMGDDETGAFESVARVLKEVGELVDAIAPAMTNGRWGPEDMAYANRIVKEGGDVVGQVQALIADVRTKVLHHNVRPLRNPA